MPHTSNHGNLSNKRYQDRSIICIRTEQNARIRTVGIRKHYDTMNAWETEEERRHEVEMQRLDVFLAAMNEPDFDYLHWLRQQRTSLIAAGELEASDDESTENVTGRNLTSEDATGADSHSEQTRLASPLKVLSPSPRNLPTPRRSNVDYDPEDKWRLDEYLHELSTLSTLVFSGRRTQNTLLLLNSNLSLALLQETLLTHAEDLGRLIREAIERWPGEVFGEDIRYVRLGAGSEGWRMPWGKVRWEWVECLGVRGCVEGLLQAVGVSGLLNEHCVRLASSVP